MAKVIVELTQSIEIEVEEPMSAESITQIAKGLLELANSNGHYEFTNINIVPKVTKRGNASGRISRKNKMD